MGDIILKWIGKLRQYENQGSLAEITRFVKVWNTRLVQEFHYGCLASCINPFLNRLAFLQVYYFSNFIKTLPDHIKE